LRAPFLRTYFLGNWILKLISEQHSSEHPHHSALPLCSGLSHVILFFDNLTQSHFVGFSTLDKEINILEALHLFTEGR
jgi:hypothetical protein